MTFENRLQLLAPFDADLLGIQHSLSLPPFAPQILNLLGDLSEMLRADPRVKALPDLYSFGFWCRRTSLEAMRNHYPDISQRLGRGILFHIGPANVPVNFAYSLVTGLLAGNANIVRVPSADFIQVRFIAEAFNALLSSPSHIDLRNHIRLVRYDRNEEDITALFSRTCDVRLIWGGDSTIENIRHHHLPARSFDITFADRYSICIIGAQRYLDEGKTLELAQGFYNDTYLFDQNACTAPHLVLWLGSTDVIKQARELFWGTLHKYALGRYAVEPRSAVDKLSKAMHFAALNEGSQIVKSQDNLITRITLEKLDMHIDDWQGNSGLFFEYALDNLEQILHIINRRYQTLSYACLDKAELHNLITAGRASGIDRIVPIGRTLEFSLDWDGYDLVRMLSRLIKIV